MQSSHVQVSQNDDNTIIAYFSSAKDNTTVFKTQGKDAASTPLDSSISDNEQHQMVTASGQ
jgi:hypothetical protein